MFNTNINGYSLIKTFSFIRELGPNRTLFGGPGYQIINWPVTGFVLGATGSMISGGGGLDGSGGQGQTAQV